MDVSIPDALVVILPFIVASLSSYLREDKYPDYVNALIALGAIVVTAVACVWLSGSWTADSSIQEITLAVLAYVVFLMRNDYQVILNFLFSGIATPTPPSTPVSSSPGQAQAADNNGAMVLVNQALGVLDNAIASMQHPQASQTSNTPPHVVVVTTTPAKVENVPATSVTNTTSAPEQSPAPITPDASQTTQANPAPAQTMPSAPVNQAPSAPTDVPQLDFDNMPIQSSITPFTATAEQPVVKPAQ
jgi:hypothetical protein